MDVQQRLAKNVRAYRRKLDLSQEKFALESQIDRTYVSGVERAARNPSIKLVEKFAKGLGVDVADLLKVPEQD
jgi:transcriptional regulator with XRE-family HTH domain